MRFLDLTLSTACENLALDEALLLRAEAGDGGEVLVWEQQRPAVVLGAGCRLTDDVDEAACRADGVPILRRSSGGGTVLLGPGCLLYTLVLDSERTPELAGIRSSYAFILSRVTQAAVSPSPLPLSRRGRGAGVRAASKRPGSATSPRPAARSPATPSSASDATCCITARCSTPSTWRAWAATCRRRRDSRNIRAGRDHAAFLSNVDLPGEEIKRRLHIIWGAETAEREWPQERVRASSRTSTLGKSG